MIILPQLILIYYLVNDEIYSFYIKFAQKRFLGAIRVLAKVINRERIRPNMKKILHTPEGVRDIYNEEYEKIKCCISF